MVFRTESMTTQYDLAGKVLISLERFVPRSRRTQPNYSSQIALCKQSMLSLDTHSCYAKPGSESELHFPVGTRCVRRCPGFGRGSCLYRSDLEAKGVSVCTPEIDRFVETWMRAVWRVPRGKSQPGERRTGDKEKGGLPTLAVVGWGRDWVLCWKAE